MIASTSPLRQQSGLLRRGSLAKADMRPELTDIYAKDEACQTNILSRLLAAFLLTSASAASQAAAPPAVLVQQGRERLAESLLETQGVTAPTPAEASQLRHSLVMFGEGALRLLQQDGVKVGLAREGVPLIDLGVVRPATAKSYQDAMPYVFGQGPPRLTPTQKEWVRLSSDIFQVQVQKGEAQEKLFTIDSPAIPFRLPMENKNLEQRIALQQQQDMPQSTAQMARALGAQSAEQIHPALYTLTQDLLQHANSLGQALAQRLCPREANAPPWIPSWAD